MKLPTKFKRIVYSITKRIVFIFFLASIFYFLPSVRIAYGQSLSTNVTQQNTTADLNATTNPDVPKNLHTYTQSVMIEVMSTVICQLAGVDPINPNQQCLGVDPKTNKIGFVKGGGGTIGIMGSMIAMTYNAPLHTGDYFGYLAQNFGVAKPAYAQKTGSGFDGIKPLIELWVAFRNFVYLLFIAVFVVIGFGIMLRINIDPRTVMSIANQLPKIIVAILLVTFSFAIAGFMIDIMWTSIYVTYNVFNDAAQKSNVVLSKSLNPTSMEGKMAFDAGGGFGSAGEISWSIAEKGEETARSLLNIKKSSTLAGLQRSDTFPFIKIGWGKEKSTNDRIVDFLSMIGGAGVGYWAASLVQTPVASLATGVAATIIAIPLLDDGIRTWIPFLLFFFVIFIAIITALFKIWFSLIMAYINIILNVIFAPFWIIAGLIPGSEIGFGMWFKDMLANLSVFPVTIGMFLLGNIFVEIFKKGGIGSGLFVPPLIGNPGDTSFFGAVIGLGIILMTPRAMAIVKDIIKTPEFKHTGAIAQSISTGLNTVNLPQYAQKAAMFGYYSGHMKDIPVVGKFFGKKDEHQ